MIGRINSVQTLGTLDGPGVRYVIFLQGCLLRCACCHNPETWDAAGGYPARADEVFKDILRYKPYIMPAGGVTLSGGEPLLQADFAAALLTLCRGAGIHTAIDTSGFFGDNSRAAAYEAAALAELVMLDIKMTDEEKYRRFTGCAMGDVLDFLAFLQKESVRVRLRYVLIPGINDTRNDARVLAGIAAAHGCAEGVEILPFKKLCAEKYASMGIPFPLADTPQANREAVGAFARKITACEPGVHII